MIPRILWHMGAGILKRKLVQPTPGALLHYPGVWKSRAGLLDCSFRRTLPENAYFRNMELAIWYGCGYVAVHTHIHFSISQPCRVVSRSRARSCV